MKTNNKSKLWLLFVSGIKAHQFNEENKVFLKSCTAADFSHFVFLQVCQGFQNSWIFAYTIYPLFKEGSLSLLYLVAVHSSFWTLHSGRLSMKPSLPSKGGLRPSHCGFFTWIKRRSKLMKLKEDWTWLGLREVKIWGHAGNESEHGNCMCVA